MDKDESCYIDDFKGYITRQENMLGGELIVYSFENGIGASVINHKGSYGLELIVLESNKLTEHQSTFLTSECLYGLLVELRIADALREEVYKG